jgi:hypothetical protein
MADFGKKGKITVRVANVGGETVDLSKGENLCYKITALGGPPIFNLMGNKTVLWTQKDFGPKMNYEIVWPRNPGDVVAKSADYLFNMSFFNDGTYKLKYTLRVEYRDSNNKIKEVITDQDYESEEPTDACEENITVDTE